MLITLLLSLLLNLRFNQNNMCCFFSPRQNSFCQVSFFFSFYLFFSCLFFSLQLLVLVWHTAVSVSSSVPALFFPRNTRLDTKLPSSGHKHVDVMAAAVQL